MKYRLLCIFNRKGAKRCTEPVEVVARKETSAFSAPENYRDRSAFLISRKEISLCGEKNFFSSRYF